MVAELPLSSLGLEFAEHRGLQIDVGRVNDGLVNAVLAYVTDGLLFSLRWKMWVIGIQRGNQEVGCPTSPRADEQYPVRPCSTISLAILPYVKATLRSKGVGMAHLPWYPKKWQTVEKEPE
jgi:hypothetical protein